MTGPGALRAVAALRRFAAPTDEVTPCDLCGVPIRDEHAHLFEPEPRRVACACTACALVFQEDTGRYRRLHSRAVRARGVELEEDDFRALDVPVRLAVLSPSAVHGCVFATYPNAGGATEAVVPRTAWDALSAGQPAVASVRPDLEGLIIDHLGGRKRAFVASLDLCYRFVGVLRAGGTRAGALGDAMRFLDALDGGGGG